MMDEYTDRYKALGIPYPDPATMCLGQCEGTGCIPITEEESNTEFKKRWQILHEAGNSHEDGKCDGWHFIVCPDCEGSGKRNSQENKVNDNN